MRTAFAALLALALLTVAATPALGAHTVERPVLIGLPATVLEGYGICARACIGFVWFPPEDAAGERPTSIALIQPTGLPALLTLCQDLDEDGLCGEVPEGEPRTASVCTRVLSVPDEVRALIDPTMGVSIFVESTPGCGPLPPAHASVALTYG